MSQQPYNINADKICQCPCHSPSPASIIMHSMPCCGPGSNSDLIPPPYVNNQSNKIHIAEQTDRNDGR